MIVNKKTRKNILKVFLTESLCKLIYLLICASSNFTKNFEKRGAS